MAKFMDKPEKLVEVADLRGSIITSKI